MPKKKNPYIIFCLETQQRNPELRGKGLPELVVLCNEEWSGMNMDQRAPYIETAKQLDDNPRYQPSFQSRTTIEKAPVEDTNPSSENINKAMMPPPPPMKPKLQRRIGGFNDSSTTPSPEMLQERLNYNSSSRAFGRFPRGALVWSSNGKPEPLNNASSLTSLQGSKLDFSPLGVLSPFNPSSPLTGVQKATPLPEGPLNNSTNSDHKVKRVCHAIIIID